MADGYGFWWHGRYWASLTTGGQPADGRHDFYFGPVPANTHGHVWVKIPPNQAPAMGSQLKDQGEHVGSPNERSFSTSPVLRGRAQWDAEHLTVTTEISAIEAPSAYSSVPVSSKRTESKRQPGRVELEATLANSGVCLARSGE